MSATIPCIASRNGVVRSDRQRVGRSASEAGDYYCSPGAPNFNIYFRKRCRARDTFFFSNECFAFAGLCGLSTAVHVGTVSVDVLDRLLDTAGYEPGPLRQVVRPT